MKFPVFFLMRLFVCVCALISGGLAFSQPASTPLPVAGTAGLDLVTNSAPILDDQHRLAVGDGISFRILEDQDSPLNLRITDSGELEVPYIGRIPAEGKTCRELAGEIKIKLEKDYYRHATVVVGVDTMAKAVGKVYIVGPVKVCGLQEIPSDEVLTLSKAILRAGGFGEFAAENKVRVTRKSRLPGGPDEVFTINVKEVLEKGNSKADLPLKDGDLIYVPTRLMNL